MRTEKYIITFNEDYHIYESQSERGGCFLGNKNIDVLKRWTKEDNPFIHVLFVLGPSAKKQLTKERHLILAGVSDPPITEYSEEIREDDDDS